jgi:hypothetical protein
VQLALDRLGPESVAFRRLLDGARSTSPACYVNCLSSVAQVQVRRTACVTWSRHCQFNTSRKCERVRRELSDAVWPTIRSWAIVERHSGMSDDANGSDMMHRWLLVPTQRREVYDPRTCGNSCHGNDNEGTTEFRVHRHQIFGRECNATLRTNACVCPEREYLSNGQIGSQSIHQCLQLHKQTSLP